MQRINTPNTTKVTPVTQSRPNPIVSGYNIGRSENAFTGDTERIQQYINQSGRKYKGFYQNMAIGASAIKQQMPGDGSFLVGIRLLSAGAIFNISSTWLLNNEQFIEDTDLGYFQGSVNNPREFIPLMRPFSSNNNLNINVNNLTGAPVFANFILIYI